MVVKYPMLPVEITFELFHQRFDTEQDCAGVLAKARWPDGFRCPICQHSQYFAITTRRLPLYECRACRRQTSVIAGTIMEGSSTSLRRWFHAIYLISQSAGISATRLAEQIQVTYKTAWLIAHKIRHALQQADADTPLHGVVRVDQIHYGFDYYREAWQPLIIAGTLDTDEQPQQIKIKQPQPAHVDNERRTIESEGVNAFLKYHVAKDAFTIFARSHKRFGVPHPPLNQIRHQISCWLNDTFHGIGPKHLQAYLDEFCFRANSKLCKIPAFDLLTDWCARTPVLIYRELISSKPVLPVPWLIWGSKAKWKGRYLTLWNA